MGANAVDHFAAGKLLRPLVSRRRHGVFESAPDRPDPVAVLEASSQGRVPRLIPVRYWRMKASPFTYYRGAPAMMAWDLAHSTPNTGLGVQACGDCHVSNFGMFGTPERNVIFDVNDFDETLTAPWEWDIKRLATSAFIAGQVNGLPAKQCSKAARAVARGYREQMRLCATMSALEIWYLRFDAQTVITQMSAAEQRRVVTTSGRPAPNNENELVAEKLTQGIGSDRRFVDIPPKLFHAHPGVEAVDDATKMLRRYRETLRSDIVHLFDRFTLTDMAVKVVGVGSVGTRCAVALLMARNNDALILQLKEASASLLEPYVGKSRFSDHGHRVVAGQQLMQSASDMFLGWTQSEDGRCYYVRQLSDMKGSVDITTHNAAELIAYGELCGRVIAAAHARSGDAEKIGGYVGISEKFDDAIDRFATCYADRNHADYELFLKAVSSGRLEAVAG